MRWFVYQRLARMGGPLQRLDEWHHEVAEALPAGRRATVWYWAWRPLCNFLDGAWMS